jgi:hypothetical protein
MLAPEPEPEQVKMTMSTTDELRARRTLDASPQHTPSDMLCSGPTIQLPVRMRKRA